MMAKQAFFWRRTRNLVFGLFLLLSVGSCSEQPPAVGQAQGYIEGHFSYLASEYGGVLTQLAVSKGQMVEVNQALAQLEPQPESDMAQAASASLSASKAARAATQANLDYARKTYERNARLAQEHAIQQSEADNAQANYLALQSDLAKAEANIAQAEANAKQATWSAEQKAFKAPKAGFVFDIYYRVGEYIKAEQALFALLDPQDIKAIFYVPATELEHIKLQQTVAVSCAGCHQQYAGKISYISPQAEYTPPVIFSEQTNQSLVYRVEASFEREQAVQLHPGQPVTVRYE